MNKRADFLTLKNCCELIDIGPWPRYYLSTIHQYLRKTPDPATKSCIAHAVQGPQSQFLDTVAEAAWGLHFWDNRIDFEVGKKLDPTYAQSTDSDFCVHRRGKTYWLDVLNVDLNQQAGQPGGASNAGVRERATLRTITSILVQRAERKFKKKFAAKRERKTLKDTSAGILLSIQSSLMAVMSPLRSNADELCISNESPLVRGMFKNFEKNVPSFSLVLIHWLGDFDCSGTLRPGHIVAWQPDDDHSFDWLFKTIPRLDKGFKVIQSAKRCR